MNLDLLLRGYARCEVVVGQPQSVDRIPRKELRNPILQVRQNYYSSEIRKIPLLPWHKPSVNLMWFIRTVCRLADGQLIYHDVALVGDLNAALDTAYLRSVEAVLNDVIAQKQHILEESA